MPPNNIVPTGVLEESDAHKTIAATKPLEKREYQLVWRSIAWMTYLHLGALYGIYLLIANGSLLTSVWVFVLYQLASLGITLGAHRLWAHRAYKAKWPLRFILVVLDLLAFQDSAIHWARDHRLHHRYSDTDADPHNANRGFFYCHMGWLMVRKLPEVVAKGRDVDVSDLYADPLLRYQKKFYYVLMPIVCFALPVMTPMYLWGESFKVAYYANLLRYSINLHTTWLVNSAAHYFGNKPYDVNLLPTQNLTVAVLTLGEGYHNYHHAFPWDSYASELGKYDVNVSSMVLELLVKIGWAYDLKKVSPEMIRSKAQKKGDGSHKLYGGNEANQAVEEKTDDVTASKKDY